uniref:Tetratricopeptide repeat protein n=1 Tax=Caenorhabditis japonica TaxID=281687 RepID=A0A8R1EIQ2_CAEJA
MGYATRMVAKAIFATPPSSTYQEALHYFLKAEQIAVSFTGFFHSSTNKLIHVQPGFYSTNTYYIGEVYEQLGDKAEAIAHFRHAFKMPVITSDDAVIHKKAHEKLRKYGVKDTEVV